MNETLGQTNATNVFVLAVACGRAFSVATGSRMTDSWDRAGMRHASGPRSYAHSPGYPHSSRRTDASFELVRSCYVALEDGADDVTPVGEPAMRLIEKDSRALAAPRTARARGRAARPPGGHCGGMRREGRANAGATRHACRAQPGRLRRMDADRPARRPGRRQDRRPLVRRCRGRPRRGHHGPLAHRIQDSRDTTGHRDFSLSPPGRHIPVLTCANLAQGRQGPTLATIP